jgi:flavorubredoxin
MQEIHPNVSWLNECYDLGDRHKHVAVYLLADPETDRYVLVDTGSFYHREAITAQVEAATDGSGLDALVLSHSDYPHAANVDAFAAEGSDVELVASSSSPLAQGLPADATRARIGGSLTVAGRELSFIDPPLADRSHTTWLYDHATAGLFVADGFGSYHQPGECDRTSADFDDGIPREAIEDFHAETLVWLRYVDPAKLRRALEAIIEAYPPAYVAPIHGHPIMGDDVDRFLDRLIDAATAIAADYDVSD